MKAKTSGQRRQRPGLAPEDKALFLDAMAGVAPLPARDRLPLPPKPPSPVRAEVIPPESKLQVESDGQRYAARSPGVSRAQITELRAGKVRAEDTLDLHGLAITPALARVRQWLLEARRAGRRCVLLVHGRGLHSESGAPLREAVIAELLGPLSGLVHALSSAAPADGGDGATYIMLRGAR